MVLIARLESSFNEASARLPFAIEQAVEDEQAERGGTKEEALPRLVLVGHAKVGTVVNPV